jgi:hypothetical protein
MRHKVFHCWDCGTRVIAEDGQGKYKPMPNLQQVRFKLSNGAYMTNPFCDTCADRTWTPERFEQFEQAIIAVMPQFAEVKITRCDGPISLIAGVAR